MNKNLQQDISKYDSISYQKDHIRQIHFISKMRFKKFQQKTLEFINIFSNCSSIQNQHTKINSILTQWWTYWEKLGKQCQSQKTQKKN